MAHPRPALRDAAARNALIAAGNHFRLVWAVIRRVFGARGTAAARRVGTDDDLFQCGALGLLRAAELYDESFGVAFATFAFWHVRQALLGALRTQDVVRRPDHVAVGDGPVTLHLGDERGLELPDRGGGPDDAPGRSEDVALAGALLAALPARERDVLRMVYLEGRRLRDVAAAMGVTKQRVQQIKAGALRRARLLARRRAHASPGAPAAPGPRTPAG